MKANQKNSRNFTIEANRVDNLPTYEVLFLLALGKVGFCVGKNKRFIERSHSSQVYFPELNNFAEKLKQNKLVRY